ncbi:MAG: ISL3 family transposase [Syntrophobacteraceae bacterium]
MPTNILHLPAFQVTEIKETEHDYHIYADVAIPLQECIHCHARILVGFGRREQLVRDLPMHGKRVGIYVNTRRFQCRACNKTFYEPLPEMDEKRLMTARLVKWIGKQSVKRPFAHIADEIGVDEKTAKNIFRDHINELEKTFRFETPQWMGIDEIHIIRPRCVISNIHNNTVVEVLPNRDKKTVIKYLSGLDGKSDVRYVAMDMWNPYKEAVYAVLRNSTIIVDKFHVLRMANDGLEKARKSLRESLTPGQRRGLMHDRFLLLKRPRDLKPEEQLLLETWTKNYPVLGEAYRLKEEFFAIYHAPDAVQAVEQYRKWQDSIPEEVYPHFQPIITAWANWHNEILNYFSHRVTNSYSECLNGLIRVMNRLGRGYSFEALRAKILFTEGVHKKAKPKFERFKVAEPKRPYRADDDEGGVFGNMTGASRSFIDLRPSELESTEIEKPEKNYGADISTLIRMLESGEL